ncbi:hypothetical protein D1007_55886 [Hordeum vulgare]|nr:hypothetical protein D1007_55886 [Hordeum vulgare]
MNASVPPNGRSEPAVLAPTTMFCPFTSPWTRDLPWRYARPLATSAAYARIAHSSSRPPLLSATSAIEPPGGEAHHGAGRAAAERADACPARGGGGGRGGAGGEGVAGGVWRWWR